MNVDVKKRLDEILLEIAEVKTKSYSEIVDFYFDKINTGDHELTPKMKDDLAYKLVYAITNFYVGVPKYIDKLVDSVDGLEELYESYTSHLTVNCNVCGEFINLHPYATNKRELTMIMGEDGKYAKCFEFGTRKYKFKTSSDTIIIANNLRNVIKTDDNFNYYSIDQLKETELLTQSFIKDNILVGYVGNTTAQVYNDDGIVTILSSDIDEYWYDENVPDDHEDSKASFMEWLNEYGSLEVYEQAEKLGLIDKSKIGTVSCSLWWIMATDKDNIDFEKFLASGDDYVEITVEPNTNYIFELEFKRRGDYDLHTYKIYKE